MTTPNVHRDGEYLVVPIEGAVFPNRCVKTNETVNFPNYAFEADLLWQQVQIPETGDEQLTNSIARTAFGATGGALLDLSRKRRLRYEIGLSRERQQVAKRRWRMGLLLVILGPCLGVILGGGAAEFTERMMGTASLPLTIAGVAVGTLLMIAGLVLFGMAAGTILGVMRSDGQQVWLSGANPNFLATLPDSPIRWKRGKDRSA